MYVWVVERRYGRAIIDVQGIYATEEAARKAHYIEGKKEVLTGSGYPELPSYLIYGDGCEIHFYKYEVRE